MKNRISIRIAWLIALLCITPTLLAQPILIDLGNASSWRGVDVPAPDNNGNYWNSVWDAAYYPNLVDIAGNPTSINFGFSSAGGTDSYNGPAGVTTNPVSQDNIDATDIDVEALGILGVNEAAMDFYVSCTFEIQGLDPTKTYDLTFFASHKYSDDDTTVISVYTDNTYSTLVASTSIDVQAPGDPGSHNRDQLATITDLDPQEFNILYVKFTGANGNNGYLNCLMLDISPAVKPKAPQPSFGATGVPVTTNLAWTKPAEISPERYVLRIGDVKDNEEDPNWITIDPVVDLNLDENPDTIEAALPNELSYNTTYYWNVSAWISDPNETEYKSPTWSFTTEPELKVNAGPNIISWLDGDLATVDLNGAVLCECSLSNIAWSVIEKPITATVSITDDSSAVTQATFDETGDYLLRLWAQDDSDPPFENEDFVEIHVYSDACTAAKANPAGYTASPNDINDDCKVDLIDFQSLAADWLTDQSLKENLEY